MQVLVTVVQYVRTEEQRPTQGLGELPAWTDEAQMLGVLQDRWNSPMGHDEERQQLADLHLLAVRQQ